MGISALFGRRKPEQSDIPSAKFLSRCWDKGRLPCTSCKKSLPISEMRLLQLQNCPHCDTPYFAPKKIADYFLYEPAGGGGMGSVYKAVSLNFPEQLLAVKVLSRRERDNPPNIHALLNEAAVSAHFRESEFIASCLDSGFADDEYFTVMDYITGERLDKRIERLNQLPAQEVVPMALHILAAEQHIYTRGFLFRDLKPENIIINPNGYAVLLDFGLCITREQALNPTDEFISGSPYYLPPERLLGNSEDAYSELYSLGMVMFHALTGRTYYDADELESLAKRHVSKLRVSSAAKLEGIFPPLAELMERMIRQNPEERPQTFAEVFEALKQINAALPPIEDADSKTETASKIPGLIGVTDPH
ncbi:MAG: serine/threonine protein kinase [Lentisphaerae bacterium]|nr:serine/threonine protein kinase [Lentisphaerota bacterium]